MADIVHRKRKRSAIACVTCHDRKVRCNVALQGPPCTNCAQDGGTCRIYTKSIVSPKRYSSNLAPRLPHQAPAASDVASISHMPLGNIARPTSMPESTLNSPEAHPERPREHREDILPNEVHSHTSQSLGGATAEYELIFAGESQGLEFLFDACAPDRSARGLHYVVPAQTYRARRTYQAKPPAPYSLPPKPVQDDLVRCFFYYVWPTLPVVDAKEFLTMYIDQVDTISPLLLWSMFFAAANFADRSLLKKYRVNSRKSFKEKCYHHAKELFDSHSERKKMILIQSAVLLSSWYIDLEDRDGMTYWIGVAMSLSFTIGLHRRDDDAPSPFPPSLRRLRRCVWWSIMFRETWTALGFGRPLRIRAEDCDVPMPTISEVFGTDIDMITPEMQPFLPEDLQKLASVWLNVLDLTVLLESVLWYYYRPRSTVPSTFTKNELEEAIQRCRTRLESINTPGSATLLLHTSHVKAYYSSVLIALYRPYLAAAARPTNHTSVEIDSEILSRASKAAAETATVLNDLVAANLIDLSPSMLITAMMSAMQIYVFLMRHSEGLGQRHAAHQIKLFVMILSHLQKTYWTAELQHNLFVEAVKAMENERTSKHKAKESAEASLETTSRQINESLPHDGGTMDSTVNTLMNGSLEEFLDSFNPFMGLPFQADDLSTSVDWEVSPSSPFTNSELQRSVR